MFRYIMVGANDVPTSKRFYDAILGALGYPPGIMDEREHGLYINKAGTLIITRPPNGAPATGANGGTIGFSAKNIAEVDAWHAAGIANGGTSCDDPPGQRQNGFYMASLLDPAGNKLCAACR